MVAYCTGFIFISFSDQETTSIFYIQSMDTTKVTVGVVWAALASQEVEPDHPRDCQHQVG